VTVTDGRRSATSRVSVVVLESGVPLVHISVPPVRNFNTANQLYLSANVDLPTTGFAFWSVNDTRINITTACLSDIYYSVIRTGLVTLTLSANIMTPGSTLLFSLTATGALELQRSQMMSCLNGLFAN
jgi:hypothetical protein